jgi:hypothetical protein
MGMTGAIEVEKDKKSEERLYGLGARFDSARELYLAAKAVRDFGFRRWDAYSPFPIHGMSEAMGLGKSWNSAFTLAGGLLGLSMAYLGQVAASVPRPAFLQGVTSGKLLHLFYPLVLQGKPYLSLPAFVPVMFETTVLYAALGTVLGVLVLNLLPRAYRPVFNWELFCGKAMDEGFFLVIEAADPLFSDEETAGFLEKLGGKDITRIPW